MKNFVKAVLCAAVLAGCGAAGDGADEQAGADGTSVGAEKPDAIGTASQELSGNRPLLVILYQPDPVMTIPQSDQFFRDRFFAGGSARSVNNYYLANSRGQFGFSEAGVLRVTDPQYTGIETTVDFPSIPAGGQATLTVALNGGSQGDIAVIKARQLPDTLFQSGGAFLGAGVANVTVKNLGSVAFNPPPYRVARYRTDVDRRAGIPANKYFLNKWTDRNLLHRRQLQLAYEAHFNFNPYAQPDGYVYPSGLAVIGLDSMTDDSAEALMVQSWCSATDASGNCTRWEDGDTSQGKDPAVLMPCMNFVAGSKVDPNQPYYCGPTARAGSQSQLMNLAHELSHVVLGSMDLYGFGSSCFGRNFSLMSCTVVGDGSPLLLRDDTYFLDPWDRMRLSWPKATSTSTDVACPAGTTCSAKLALASKAYGTLPTGSVEAHQFSSGNNSLFMEYRKPGYAFDSAVPQEGVALWFGNTNNVFVSPANVPNLVDGRVTDPGVFNLAPVNCVADPTDARSRGVFNPGAAQAGQIFAKFGSSYRLKWLNGADSGYLFTIGQPVADQVTVTWTKTNATPECAQNAPDYFVSAGTNPQFPYLTHHGGTLVFTDTTQSTGRAVPQSSTTSYYISVDPTLSSDDIRIASRTVPGLAAGGSSTGTGTGLIPWSAPLGDVYFITCADTGNTVAESSETNNCFVSTDTMLILF